MYARCLFCNVPFGANAAIEEQPVGRRLAFDQDRGRLWVICRACARWNLTPIDERWEAIEACERAFRATRVRISSDNIGLAELPDGLTLVRIGRPLSSEFAAWRYGRQFLRRRYRRPLDLAGRAILLGLAPALGVGVGAAAALAVAGMAGAAALALWRKPAAHIPLDGRGQLRVSLPQMHSAALVRDDAAPEGWALLCHHLPAVRSRIASVRQPPEPALRVTLTGPEARAGAALLLPRLNRVGGDPETVQEAVRWLQAAGGPARAFPTIARSSHVRPALNAAEDRLASLHDPVRLALEMAIHEDEERRLLAGELSVLTWMWRREESLAAIADGLGIPEWLEQELLRRKLHSSITTSAR